MSFMFNPYPYEDIAPVNRPVLSEETINSITTGPRNVVAGLLNEIHARRKKENAALTIGMDGYVAADWEPIVNLLSGELTKQKINVRVFNVASCYKSRQELDAMLAEYLPQDLKKDPVLLFGKLFKGGYETLFDQAKLDALKQQIKAGTGVNIVYGAGSCFAGLRPLCDIVTFFDVTPKQAVLLIKSGNYKNLGDCQARPFKEIMRRCYYYDFELAVHLRAELVSGNLLDFYIANDNPATVQLVPRRAFNEICSSLVNYPFRCKPVIWKAYGADIISKRCAICRKR